MNQTSAPIIHGDYRQALELIIGAASAEGSLIVPSARAGESLGTNKDHFYWDIDGYVDPGRVGIEHADEVQIGPGLQSLSIVHYLLRSSLILDANVDAEGWSAFQTFSQACLSQALGVMRGDSLTRPVWVDEFMEKLRASSTPPTDSRLDQVQVACVIRPQIFAFSYPAESRIEVAAMSREHLRTINLLLWSVAEAVLEPSTRANAADVGESLIDHLLPWVFALYFSDSDYSRLPILRAPNGYVVAAAQRFARIQVEFMLAHEFAHMLTHEGRIPSRDLEHEADSFAYDLLFDAEPFKAAASGFETFAAIRWLFLYLSLDRIVGSMMSGYPVDWTELPIRDRDLPLIRRLPTLRAPLADQSVWQLGDLMLMEAKYALYRRGPEWLRQKAADFRSQFGPPAALKLSEASQPAPPE